MSYENESEENDTFCGLCHIRHYDPISEKKNWVTGCSAKGKKKNFTMSVVFVHKAKKRSFAGDV